MLRYFSVLAILFLIFALPVTASQAKSAIYNVTLVVNGITHTLTINETVSSTSNPAWDVLTIALTGQNWSLSYSRSVNSTHKFFPYVPSVANQTLKFNGTNYSILVSLQKNGTKDIQFNGNTYTLTTYSFIAEVNSKMYQGVLHGEVDAFPSNLLYMATLSSKNVKLTVQLVSTNIPLNLPSASAQEQAASIIIGVGAVVAVVAGSIGMRHIKRITSKEAKEHWVD